MIVSFADKQTEKLWNEKPTRLPADHEDRAANKLALLHAAPSLAVLRVPPSNRLELLKGKYAGYHSIRINSQWRLCFHWKNGHAYDVQITDYH